MGNFLRMERAIFLDNGAKKIVRSEIRSRAKKWNSDGSLKKEAAKRGSWYLAKQPKAALGFWPLALGQNKPKTHWKSTPIGALVAEVYAK